jgi:hypothetical protein
MRWSVGTTVIGHSEVGPAPMVGMLGMEVEDARDSEDRKKKVGKVDE